MISKKNRYFQVHEAAIHNTCNLNTVLYILTEFTPVSAQTSFRYQNPFDAPLKMACRSGRGAIKRIISIHDNRREDRRWAFLCGHVINPAHCFQCRRTNPVNVYRGPLMFNCPPNQVLSGVESIHSNAKEDRIWRFVCCESYKHVTTKCELTGSKMGLNFIIEISMV